MNLAEDPVEEINLAGKNPRKVAELQQRIEALARGEAEIALQQVRELLPVPGVDLVGPLPAQGSRTQPGRSFGSSRPGQRPRRS